LEDLRIVWAALLLSLIFPICSLIKYLRIRKLLSRYRY
jgi:hypothetical protein